MKKILAAIMCVVCFSGCNGKIGTNLKFASADAGAGLTAVGILESVPVQKFDATKEVIQDAASTLMLILKEENLSALPIDEIKILLHSALIKKGYIESIQLVDIVIAYVVNQQLPIGQAIGSENAEMIRISLESVIRNIDRCTVEGRTDWSELLKRGEVVEQKRLQQRCMSCGEISLIN